jgi:hypothetical protein
MDGVKAKTYEEKKKFELAININSLIPWKNSRGEYVPFAPNRRA